MNYKIKVNVDIEELISLFSALGCKYFNHTVTEKNYMIVEDGKAFFCKLKSDFKKSGCKEISIDQLKDMVVLKRNDPKDENVYQYGDVPCLYNLYLTSDKNLYFFFCGKGWKLSAINDDDDYRKLLKPITKEPVMKEYLNKLEDGTYKLVLLDSIADGVDGLIEVPEGVDVAFQASSDSPVVFKRSECGYSNAVIVWQRKTIKDKEYLRKNSDGKYVVEVASEQEANEPHAADWIEVPEGCNIITCQNRMGALFYFHWKSLGSDEFFLKDEKIWSNNFNETLSDFIEKNKGDVKIIWKRHTQPEELPFTDNEPKYNPKETLNDKVASADVARQEFIGAPFSDLHGYFEAVDEFVESNVEQDNVNQPSHYNKGGVECIDAIQSSMTHEAFCGYLKGNVQKYMWRYENKGGVESLEKAQWYLNKLIEVRNENSSED